jgi:hypothetical protein
MAEGMEEGSREVGNDFKRRTRGNARKVKNPSGHFFMIIYILVDTRN